MTESDEKFSLAEFPRIRMECLLIRKENACYWKCGAIGRRLAREWNEKARETCLFGKCVTVFIGFAIILS